MPSIITIARILETVDPEELRDQTRSSVTGKVRTEIPICSTLQLVEARRDLLETLNPCRVTG